MAPSPPPPMYYAELPVAPELAPWIAAHWTFRVRPGVGEIEHTIPLTGGVQLTVSRTHVLLAGPRSEPLRTVVRGGEVFWGSHLWPGAAPPLLGLGVDGLAALEGAVVPAAPILGGAWCQSLVEGLSGLPGGPDRVRAVPAAPAAGGDRSADAPPAMAGGPAGDTLAATGDGTAEEASAAAGGGATGDLPAVEGTGAAVLDAAWSLRPPPDRPLDGPVMGAVFQLLAAGGDLAIADLARDAGLSRRQFRRRFRAAVGLSPKELARIQRLRTSAVGMVRAPGGSWAELAAEHGYADQAHLVREYRRLLGLTPTRFRRHTDSIEHGALLR